jgi:hypothetical protein
MHEFNVRRTMVVRSHPYSHLDKKNSHTQTLFVNSLQPHFFLYHPITLLLRAYTALFFPPSQFFSLCTMPKSTFLERYVPAYSAGVSPSEPFIDASVSRVASPSRTSGAKASAASVTASSTRASRPRAATVAKSRLHTDIDPDTDTDATTAATTSNAFTTDATCVSESDSDSDSEMTTVRRPKLLHEGKNVHRRWFYIRALLMLMISLICMWAALSIGYGSVIQSWVQHHTSSFVVIMVPAMGIAMVLHIFPEIGRHSNRFLQFKMVYQWWVMTTVLALVYTSLGAELLRMYLMGICAIVFCFFLYALLPVGYFRPLIAGAILFVGTCLTVYVFIWLPSREYRDGWTWSIEYLSEVPKRVPESLLNHTLVILVSSGIGFMMVFTLLRASSNMGLHEYPLVSSQIINAVGLTLFGVVISTGGGLFPSLRKIMQTD